MIINVPGSDGTSQTQTSISELPHQCPFCHKSIRPTPIYGFLLGEEWTILMNCPDRNCRESFIAYYQFDTVNQHYSAIRKSHYLDKTSFGRSVDKPFSKEVVSVSPSFVKIYNEAYQAEQQGLLEICGVGYRKALEFLIKDYLILSHPDDKDKIEKKMLSPCINDYVNDDRIKSVATRAVWLGNDETHYVKKWEGKNLVDLKKLIDLTLYWIEAEILTASFSEEMPS